MRNATVDALENVVSRFSPLRDNFSVEIIYKPSFHDDITNVHVFNDYQQILHFVENVDVFKDEVIDEDEHLRVLQDATSSSKGNLMPKCVVSLEKLYDPQNHLWGYVNAKTIAPICCTNISI